uniref:Uncharacterized protein n=1 Tax=Ditylenchus dipsaci TaxID=166011 RepID=A0A915DE76_9BILA
MKSLVLGGQDDGRRTSVALSGSLSWLEFGHIEYDSWTLLLAPFLAVAQGLQFLFIKKAYTSYCTLSIREGVVVLTRKKDGLRSFPYTSLAGCRSFVFSQHLHPILTQWYLMMQPGSLLIMLVLKYIKIWHFYEFYMKTEYVFMASYKYSELWMQTHIELHHYCVLEHSKFFVASVGQWFLQNMAHATIYAAVGKALFVASSFRYWSNFGGTWSKKESEA